MQTRRLYTFECCVPRGTRCVASESKLTNLASGVIEGTSDPPFGTLENDASIFDTKIVAGVQPAAPRQVSRRKMLGCPAVVSLVKFVALETNATNLPSTFAAGREP